MGLITNLHSFLLPLTSLGRIDCVLKLPPPPRFSPQAVSIIIQLNRELWLRPFEAISKDEIAQPFQLVICAGSSCFQRNLYRESLIFRGTRGPPQADCGKSVQTPGSKLQSSASDDFNVTFSHKPARKSLCRKACIYLFTKPPSQNEFASSMEQQKGPVRGEEVQRSRDNARNSTCF